MEDVADETQSPDGDSRPEDGSGDDGCEKGGCGVGVEVGAHQGAIEDVEDGAIEGNADVGFGARGRAEGGEEGAVGVVDQEETDENELGRAEGLGVGWGGYKGFVDECVDKGNGGDDFHHDPCADTVDEEDAVGRGGESTKRCIDDKLEGENDGWYDERELSED